MRTSAWFSKWHNQGRPLLPCNVLCVSPTPEKDQEKLKKKMLGSDFLNRSDITFQTSTFISGFVQFIRTMKRTLWSGVQSCLPACFQGMVNMVFSASTHSSPGIVPPFIFASSHGRNLFRLSPSPLILQTQTREILQLFNECGSLVQVYVF